MLKVSFIGDFGQKEIRIELMEETPISEGIYQLDFEGTRMVVEVRMTMQGRWPDTRESLMVFPLSGPPRFPWKVSELREWGCTLKQLT